MLIIKNLEVSIGKINILKSVSLKVQKFSSVIGRNGAGKTTLIRAIMNILPSQSGHIKFQNKNLNNLKTYNMSKLGIGYMPEDRRLVPDLSVKDNIRSIIFYSRIKRFFEQTSVSTFRWSTKISSFSKSNDSWKKSFIIR